MQTGEQIQLGKEQPAVFTMIESGTMAGTVEIEIEVEAHGGDFVDATAYLSVEDRVALIEFLKRTLP